MCNYAGWGKGLLIQTRTLPFQFPGASFVCTLSGENENVYGLSGKKLMDAEIVRNYICLFAILLVMFGAAISFNRVTKRPEFLPLLESGQSVNLNLGTLWAAYFRHDNDPLKPAHKRLAKIGFLYFTGVILGIVLFPIAIVSAFLFLGVGQ